MHLCIDTNPAIKPMQCKYQLHGFYIIIETPPLIRVREAELAKLFAKQITFKLVLDLLFLRSKLLLSLCSTFYKKIYLQTNSTASTYMSGVIFFALPHTMLITT